MKKSIYIGIAIAALSVVGLTSCESIDEVPPYKESTTGKVYKIADPKPMTAQDVADFNAIRAEYEEATK